MKARRENSGFTLIELLVVIAIIAILAAILFPVFLSAKEKGRQAACFSNLKEIGTGLIMYVDDYEAYVHVQSSLQGKWSWPNRMMRYVKNFGVFKCPSDTMPPPKNRRDYMCSYSINSLLVGRKTSELGSPSRIIFIEDTFYPDNPQGIYYHSINLANWGCGFNTGGPLNYIDQRHSGGTNFCFADGHVKWYKIENTINQGENPVSPYTDPKYMTQSGISYMHNYRGN